MKARFVRIRPLEWVNHIALLRSALFLSGDARDIHYLELESAGEYEYEYEHRDIVDVNQLPAARAPRWSYNPKNYGPGCVVVQLYYGMESLQLSKCRCDMRELRGNKPRHGRRSDDGQTLVTIWYPFTVRGPSTAPTRPYCVLR